MSTKTPQSKRLTRSEAVALAMSSRTIATPTTPTTRARYQLLKHVQDTLPVLEQVFGITEDQYYDALDKVKIDILNSDNDELETVSIKVGFKRAQEYIYLRNQALEKSSLDWYRNESVDEYIARLPEGDIKDLAMLYQACLDDVTDKLTPYGLNKSHDSRGCEGFYWYGNLKSIDDEDVDAKEPVNVKPKTKGRR